MKNTVYPVARLFAVMTSLTMLLVSGHLHLGAQSAQAVAASARVAAEVNPVQLSRLQGHVPVWATAANDQGELDLNRQLTNMHLVLARAPEVEAAFQQLLADQQNPASPRYHQWLTPQQNAEQFGIAASDVTAVTTWLQSQGLTVDDVAAGGVFITFSGRAADVGRAFSVAIHNYSVGSGVQYGISEEPSVPTALAGVVRLVSGLSQQMMQRHSIRRLESNAGSAGFAQPFYTSSGGSHALAPADFNAIYDITPVLNSGMTGSGQHAAIVIDSRVAAADISGFDTFFGISSSTVNQVLVPNAGSDPGLGDGESEADLDVQRILGTAPGTQVDLLVIGSLQDSYIETALQYNNTQLNDAVVNMSFGACTYGESASQAAAYDSYFSTGSAQGISYFASSGDNAAAGCNDNYKNIPSNQVLSTSYPCSSIYVTCVGGTEFNDSTNAATYWASTNNATTKQSALGYIPEGAWNEPSSTGSAPYDGSGTGGGVTPFPKPSWQTGTGVPSDSVRDVPDVSFTASGHDGYYVCQADMSDNCSTGSFKYVILGTSASSPSMAGVGVLLNQTLGARQGNLNPLIYKLAASTPAAFHDATPATSGVANCTVSTPSMCNNSTPTSSSLTGGLAGYPLTTGYDLATGWGSLDVNSFLAAALAEVAPAFSISAASATLTISPGSSATDLITLTSSNSFSGSVALTCAVANSSGTAAGSCSLSSTPVTLAAGGTATTTLTVFANSSTSGSLHVTLTGTSGSTSVTSSVIVVTVTGATFTVTPASTALSAITTAGASVTDSITVGSVNGFASSVSLSCKVANVSGTATGTCSLNPTTVTPASGGTAISTLTVTPGTGTYGVLNAVITGTSGTTVITAATIGVTLNSSSAAFTLAASPSTLTLAAGASSGNTDVITATSTNDFSGTVGFTCAVALANGGTATIPPTCSLSPTSVTLTSGGTATSTVTIGTQSAITGCTTSLSEPAPWSMRGTALAAILLLVLPFRKRKALRGLFVLGLCAVGMAWLTGCGSGGAVSTPCSTIARAGTTSGTYTVTVTGASGTVTPSPTTSFTLIVQ